ncbi:MAG: response regulator transcription factor [Acidobacteriaceae bacterium]|nr:response regulator transcription factor [Acidobacteriaceae bacterium]
MRVLIVDDEPIARQVLRQELELVEDVEIIGEAENGLTALEKISTAKPELVFLDLEMPHMTGFEMINRLHETPAPVIVIVTAYDQHAIRAFEAGAIDYLLKPVSQPRLAQTLERVRRLVKNPLQIAERIGQLQAIAPNSASPPQIRKVVGKLGEEYFLLDIQEVLAFQAEGDLTWIITAKQRYLATQNLKAIEDRLQNSMFRRIHRNALVNVNQIRKLSMLSSQRWLVTLTNGLELIVSKRQAKQVRPFLTW